MCRVCVRYRRGIVVMDVFAVDFVSLGFEDG